MDSTKYSRLLEAASDNSICREWPHVVSQQAQSDNGSCDANVEHKQKGNSPTLSASRDVKNSTLRRSKKVKCSNAYNSCDWEGSQRDLDSHLNTCGYALVSCPNQCKNDGRVTQISQRELQAHLDTCANRSHCCHDCGEVGGYQEMTTTHLETCQNVMVHCPNSECHTLISRCNLPDHRSTCVFEPVDCKYAEIGCKAKLQRKDLETHEEEDRHHLRVSPDEILEMKKNITTLSTQLRLKQLELTECSHIFKLTNFEERKRNDDIYYSSSFYTSSRGYKMCIGVYSNGKNASRNTHVSVYAHLMRGKNDGVLRWPFTGTVNIGILNQLADENHHVFKITFIGGNTSSQRVADGEHRGLGYGFDLIRHTELDYDPVKNCQFLKDGILFFKVAVEEDRCWLKCTLSSHS